MRLDEVLKMIADLRNVLVTGGAGFLGSVIVRKLLEEYPDTNIIVLDKSVEPADEQLSRIQYYRADITLPQEVRGVFDATKPDAVIHTAGLIPSLSERYQRRLEKLVFSINVDGTRNVLEAAMAAKCNIFIYTSSCCAVTDDLTSSFANIDETWPVSRESSIYGESKVKAEELVFAAQGPNFATCILRPSVIYGESDEQLIPSIYACIAKGETRYVIGKGTNLWDVDYVGNVADAHLLALKNLLTSKSAAGEVFFIQHNEAVPFRDLCLEIWKHFHHIPPYEITIPASFGWLMGTLAEWYSWLTGQPVTLSRGSVMDACAVRYASGRKARETLGHEPRVRLDEGLRLSCEVISRRAVN
jgi:sterol-4alpha-carboxylate 3-dehydrogenase (decarboxylating)